MARRQGGTLGTFTPLSTPNAPTGLSVSTSIGSASVSFTAPTDTGDAAVTSYIVTAIDESTGASSGTTGSASPITISPGGGTFKIRAQAVNGFGPGRLTEFSTGNSIFSGTELYAWGNGSYGRLGDNTVVNKSSPVQVGSLTTWSHVGVNASFAQIGSAINTTGELYTWGNNDGGQLGHTDTVNKSSPVQVGSLTNWQLTSADVFSTQAIKTDGTLWAWGDNGSGQTGDNTTVTKSSPVQIGAESDWVLVGAAGETVAALDSSGALYAWGANAGGQLGQNDTVRRSSPVQVGALTDWSTVSVGGASQFGFCVAVKTDNSLWSWGYNTNGALGHNDTVHRSSPVQVGALTNWAKVSASSSRFSLAIKTDGTLWGWGYNANGGRIGDNTIVTKSSPVQIGALTNWSSVSAGSRGGLSVKTDGTLWAWGQNVDGPAGDGTTVNRSSPVQVGAETTWSAVSARNGASFALLGVV